MKIAYVLSADPCAENGVNKKVRSQVMTWKKLGHDVQVFSILVNRGKKRNINYLQAKIYQRKRIFFVPRSFRRDIDHFNPDVIYLRFEILKPFHLTILKRYDPVVEINSDDRMELKLLARESVRGMIKYLYNLLAREWFFFKAAGIVSVSPELLNQPGFNRFKRPQVVIPNSLRIDGYQTKKRGKKQKIPHLLFLAATDYSWHGIDKIIRLAGQTRDRLFFHIVGPGRKGFPPSRNVRFYGYLSRNEYEKVVEHCDIGISALALHRKNMGVTSAIKLLEYLAYGLPSIVGYRETVFEEKGYPGWILKLENSESNTDDNLEKIVDFCYQYKNRVLKKTEVAEYIDSGSIEKRRLDFFFQIKNGIGAGR